MADMDDISTWATNEADRPFVLVEQAEEAASTGEVAEAERLYLEGIARYRSGGEKPDYALGRYGEFLYKQGRFEDAARVLGEAVDMATDIPAIWGDLFATQVALRDIDAMFAAYQKLPAQLAEYGIASWLLAPIWRVVKDEDYDFAEVLSRRVRDEAARRDDPASAFRASGEHGHILERMDRLDDAIDEWQGAFDAGSTDTKTVERLSLSLDRCKRFEESAAVIRIALERGYPANVEETLRKRLVRLEAKFKPGTPKTDVPAYSVRSGEGYASLVMQRRLSPPIRDIAVVRELAYCLGYTKETSVMTRVDLATGDAVVTKDLPALDSIKVSASGWGLGTRHADSFLAFLSPECEVVGTSSLPDTVSEVAGGAGRWYVGCRNGRLYSFDERGRSLWEWVMAGADPAPDNPYDRPHPYFVAATEEFVTVASLGNIFAIDPEGRQLWAMEVPSQEPITITIPIVGGPLGHAEAFRALGIKPGVADDEVKSAYRQMVLATHPDHHPDDSEAAAKFRRVQSAYEELLAAPHSELRVLTRQVTAAIGYRIVRYLGTAADSILVASSDGVLAMLDANGTVRSRRIVGRSDVKPVLNTDGSLSAAWCEGTLSFFEGDSIVNAIEVDGWPSSLTPWGDDVLCVERSSARVFNRTGQILWSVDFAKRLAGSSINDRYLVCGAGALVVFERVVGEASLPTA